MAFARSYDPTHSCDDLTREFPDRIRRRIGGGAPTPSPTPSPGPSPTPSAKLVARPAPEGYVPQLVDVDINDTGVIDVASREQIVSATVAAAGDVEILLLQDGKSYGLRLVVQNAQTQTFAWQSAVYTKVGDAGTFDLPGIGGSDLRCELRGDGSIYTYQNEALRHVLPASVYLGKNPALADQTRTKAQAVGVGLTAVTVGRYSPYYPPISIVETTVSSDGVIEAIVDYYCADAEYLDLEAFDSALNVAVARQHGKIVEYIQPGRVRIRANTTIPLARRGVPLTLRLSLLTSGKSLSGSVMWKRPMLFTVNVTQPGNWYGNQPLANHICLDDPRNKTFAGYNEPTPAGPDTANPEVDYKGNLIEGTGRTRIAWHINMPRIPGQRMRVKVKGSATIKLTSNGASTVRNAVTGSGGGYTWVDYNHDWSPATMIRDGRKDDNFVWFEMTATGTGATWPTDYDCRPISDNGTAISPGFWDRPYLDEIKSLMGHQVYDIARFMDAQRTVHISGQIINRVSQPGDRHALTGVSVDDILDFCEYVGCWARINLPMQATEANVRAEARKVAKWCKRTGLRAVIEWANEIWNSQQAAWGVAVALGKAMGMPTTGHDNDIANRYHSFGQVQRMGWVRDEFLAEGVADKLIRTVCVQNSNEGNQATICENAVGALDAWDRLETAPYIAGGAAISPTSLLLNAATNTWDNEAFVARARVSYRAEHKHALYHQAYAHSKGKDYGTYEGGQEDAGDGRFHRQFQISQLAGVLAREQLDDWATNGPGGAYRWYADNRHDKYGLRVHVTQPRVGTNDVPGAPVWDAWLTKMDEVKAAA